MKYKYCAVLKEAKDGIAVSFPDIFGAVTCGNDFDDAILMAKDLLKMMLTEARAQCGEPVDKQKMENLFPEENIVEIEVEI